VVNSSTRKFWLLALAHLFFKLLGLGSTGIRDLLVVLSLLKLSAEITDTAIVLLELLKRALL